MGRKKDQASEDQRLWSALCAEVKPLHSSSLVSSEVSAAATFVEDQQELDAQFPSGGSRSRSDSGAESFPPPSLDQAEVERLRTWSTGVSARGMVDRGAPRLASRVPEIPRFYAHMDGRMQQRFRTGKIRPEAELDLHGFTEARAAETFSRFLSVARQRGLRCVLVVTGKGQGVLQRALARWLESPAVKQSLIGVAPMPNHKGGSGAFCLYLRK